MPDFSGLQSSKDYLDKTICVIDHDQLSSPIKIVQEIGMKKHIVKKEELQKILEQAMTEAREGKPVRVSLRFSLTEEQYADLRQWLDSTDLEKEGIVTMSKVDDQQKAEQGPTGKQWRKEERKKRGKTPGEPDVSLP